MTVGNVAAGTSLGAAVGLGAGGSGASGLATTGAPTWALIATGVGLATVGFVMTRRWEIRHGLVAVGPIHVKRLVAWFALLAVAVGGLLALSLEGSAGAANPPPTVSATTAVNPVDDTIVITLAATGTGGYFDPLLLFKPGLPPGATATVVSNVTGDSGRAVIQIASNTPNVVPCPGNLDTPWLAPNGPNQGPLGNYGDTLVTWTMCDVAPPKVSLTATPATTCGDYTVQLNAISDTGTNLAFGIPGVTTTSAFTQGQGQAGTFWQGTNGTLKPGDALPLPVTFTPAQAGQKVVVGIFGEWTGFNTPTGFFSLQQTVQLPAACPPPTTTTTVPPTTTTTVAPAATPPPPTPKPPAPTTGAPAATPASATTPLAFTGSPIERTAEIGGGLLATGGVLLVLARRNRKESHATK